MNFIKKIKDIRPETKDTNTPLSGIIFKDSPNVPNSIASLIFKRQAPPITGIDMRNENSPAVLRSTLSHKAVAIVDPDLDTPGRMAIPWNVPIISACVQVIALSLDVTGAFLVLYNASPIRNNKPHTTIG